MNADAISAVQHDEVAPAWPRAVVGADAAASSFSTLVQDGLAAVSGKLAEGQAGLQALALGEADSLHDVMVRLEESRIAFQLMLQVRNRLLESYQEVMRMQL